MKISKLDVVAVLVIFLAGLTLAPLPVLNLVVVPVMITVWQGISAISDGGTSGKLRAFRPTWRGDPCARWRSPARDPAGCFAPPRSNQQRFPKSSRTIISLVES